jgi:hypothetical protein
MLMGAVNWQIGVEFMESIKIEKNVKRKDKRIKV